MISYPKRLIEVDLPIKKISEHARREKSIRHGHISTLHIWWARRPLAACRAVICAALWPDPADPKCPERFKTESAKLMKGFRDKRGGKPYKWDDGMELRKALLDFIADFANWDNSTNKDFIEISKQLTQIAHESLGGEPGTRPLVVDPFAGGGSIPLEALRVGADAFASDLNPVAVLLNKVVLEYIPKYGQRLADEVRKWGEWIKKKAEKELAEFYPKDSNGAVPIAYLWARTIRCEGPGCGAEVPLMRSSWLVKKDSRSVALKMIPNKQKKRVEFEIIENATAKNVAEGTVRRGSATCPICGYTTPANSLKQQFRKRKGGTIDSRLIAVVTESADTKHFRTVTPKDIDIVNKAARKLQDKKREVSTLSFVPNEDTTHYHTFVNRASVYGFETWEDFYTIRQRLALGTFSNLVKSLKIELPNNEGLVLAVNTLLAFAVDRSADYWSSLATWAGEFVAHTFGRQALPFVWDFAEVNPFSQSTGNWLGAVEWIAKVVEREAISYAGSGECIKANAALHPLPSNSVHAFITDPPYYYAIQYGDLSDYFYVWLRRSIGEKYPDLLSFPETPKAEEAIVQSPGDEYKVEGKNRAHYERVMGQALRCGREMTVSDGLGIVVFANATTEGWESLLDALISTGWIVTGSWPIDTERPGRVISSGRSVLASSVHLVCRPRRFFQHFSHKNDIGDWRDVLAELPKRIHEWMPRLAKEGVVGADAIFACLGPALEIFSRYSRVEKASGEFVTLKEYLEHVWAAVAKEALNMIFEGAETAGFEEDARLTAMWLWTLSTGVNGNGASYKEDDIEDEEGDEEKPASKTKLSGYTLEYDAARKIAQGLGAHLERLQSLVEIKGDKARLLPVAERTRALFGKDEVDAPRGRKKKAAQQKFDFMTEVEEAEESGSWGEKNVPQLGKTTLDRLHQAMILFAAGRGEALKRFLVEEGVGRDERFWRLAQALSALYPKNSNEKRWIDGVLARKKGLGL